jgi:hypothetical protein
MISANSMIWLLDEQSTPARSALLSHVRYAKSPRTMAIPTPLGHFVGFRGQLVSRSSQPPRLGALPAPAQSAQADIVAGGHSGANLFASLVVVRNARRDT